MIWKSHVMLVTSDRECYIKKSCCVSGGGHGVL